MTLKRCFGNEKGNLVSELQPQSLARGFKLGFGLFAVFALSALGAYILVGELGSEGVAQILIAAVLGPIIGSILFAIWWRFPQKSSVNKDT